MMAAPEQYGQCIEVPVAALPAGSVEVGRKNLLSRSSTS